MRGRKSVTLQDVAEAAGVTKMAVSVVLNGSRSKARVSETTRIRIQDIALKLGYRPNAIARSLQSSRTNIIGLYGHRPLMADTYWFSNILAGIQRGCAEHGFDLLLHGKFQSETDPVRYDVAYGELANGKVDGLLVVSHANDPLLPRIQGSFLGLVAIAEPMPGMPCVRADDITGFCLLMRHLHERGHRRIIMRYLTEPNPTMELRMNTVREEAQLLGMQVHETEHDYFRATAFSDEEEVLLALDRSDRCTAMLAFSDHALTPVLYECQRRGWRIPQDLALAGYDGVRMWMEPPPRWEMTTIRTHPTDVARRAVAVLAKVLEGEAVPAETILPVEFSQGTST